MTPPSLTFFCELPAKPLVELLGRPDIIRILQALRARVSMAILDCTAERADVVRQLSDAGIPVTAWLLLPRAQGYFFNADNARAATTFYHTVRSWTVENSLHWDGIGIDIEPDIRELELFVDSRRWRLLPRFLFRLFDTGSIRRADQEYRSLIQAMHADGYRVESYVFPWVIDERLVGSTLLQRAFRTNDVQVDREIPMLYSSLLKLLGSKLGAGMLWSYAPDCQSIAVGSTGGGNEIPALTCDELRRDLRLAQRWTDTIAIHSLEGCVSGGYLEQIMEMDWQERVQVPLAQARRIDQIRQLLRAILWLGERPLLLLIIMVGVACVLRGPKRTPT